MFEKKALLFLRFSPEYRSSNIFAVTEHSRNHIFLERYPKNFFSPKTSLWSIRWIPKLFFKIVYSRNLHFAEHTRNEFHRTLSIRRTRWLSIRGMDFIAGCAYAEIFKSRISRPYGIRFSKISCYRPLGP